MATPLKPAILDPMWSNNPITMQVLGVCSALAVTVQLAPALVMGGAVIAVLVASNLVVSLLRRRIPHRIRILVMLAVIASLVIVVDLLLRAFAWQISRQLSIFVGLIITNCIVLGRAEGFAMFHPPGRAVLDGFATGLGYAAVLAAVAALRELLAPHNGLAVLAPGAFFLLGVLVWIQRALTRHQEAS
jgi:Na+-transporting NADH:ubiquinone oxidoreductase subunit D